jgi:hypothetical protein
MSDKKESEQKYHEARMLVNGDGSLVIYDKQNQHIVRAAIASGFWKEAYTE